MYRLSVRKKIKRLKNIILYGWRVRIKAKKCGSPLKVNAKSIVSKNTILGNNVNFNGMKIVGNGECRIGNNFHSGQNCQIITQNHNYNTGDAIPYDRTIINKTIIIEDNVWFGNNVIVVGNVHIGEGAIIQAGAVVVSNIPKCAIAGGNPARVFKMRNEQHYYALKEKNKFL